MPSACMSVRVWKIMNASLRNDYMQANLASHTLTETKSCPLYNRIACSCVFSSGCRHVIFADRALVSTTVNVCRSRSLPSHLKSLCIRAESSTELSTPTAWGSTHSGLNEPINAKLHYRRKGTVLPAASELINCTDRSLSSVNSTC